MPPTALRLAKVLAIRLGAILPSPIHVLVEQPSSPAMSDVSDVIVLVHDGIEPWGGQGFSDSDLRTHDDSSVGDVVCSMAIAMLGGVQDSVIRIRRERWPRLPTGDIALPDGRADSERVYLWFGASENHAVVTLRPMDLRELSP
jgi:hypothetical protein